MNDRSKYLLKNVISFALGRLGTKLINFLFVPLYTYLLTTEDYGTIDLIITLGTVLTPLLILSIGESVMRFCLDQGSDHQKIMSTAMVVLFFGTLAGLVLVPVSGFIPQLANYGWIVYAYVISVAYSQVFLSYLRGQEKLNAYAIGNIIHTLMIVSFNLLFLVVFQWGIKGYLAAYIVSNILTAVYAAVVGRVHRLIHNFKLDRQLSREMIRYSVMLIPNAFLWWILDASDRIMITAMLGASINGIYAIAYKIPSLMSTLSGVFTQAWSYSAIREESSADKTEYHNEMYNYMVQMMGIATAGILMVIKPFLSIYVAPEYFTAWKYTPFLLIGFLFSSLATFLSTSYTVHKDSLGFLLSSLLGAGVNVLTNLLLIPHRGAMGAAIATCISYICVFIFRLIHTRQYVKTNVFQVRHWIGYLLLAAMCGVVFVEGFIGQIILIVLFAVNLFLSKDMILMILNQFIKRLKH